MKKEDLTTIGLTDDQAAKVLELNQSDIADSTKDMVPRTRLNEVIEERKAAENTIAERDKQLESLKKSSGDTDAMKQQIEQLQEENKAEKEKHEAAIQKIKMDNAVDAALVDAGAKNSKAVKGLLLDFLETAKLGEDGKVVGLSEQLNALRGAEDSGFLFKEAAGSQKPNLSGLKPGESGDGAPNPKAAGFEARLADARKNGNSLEALAVKREAFEAGINLI